jgi:hypothetical protein
MGNLGTKVDKEAAWERIDGAIIFYNYRGELLSYLTALPQTEPNVYLRSKICSVKDMKELKAVYKQHKKVLDYGKHLVERFK